MFSIAYVILPFSNLEPADAIRASLAPFRLGGRENLPDELLAFQDKTAELQSAHEATFTFTDEGKSELRIESHGGPGWYLDVATVRQEMQRLGLHNWRVRFADTMTLDTFHDVFCRYLERHPATGRYGQWLNPFGHWDWWDLGGRYDGLIIGGKSRGVGRSAGQLSSGRHIGRSFLFNISDLFKAVLPQPPSPTINIRTDRNIQLAATLLADMQANREHACPSVIVLPPDSVETRLRWLDDLYGVPDETVEFLGLPPDASWEDVVTASYALFQDHWVAGITYHC